MKTPTRSPLKVIALLLAFLTLAVVSQEARAATFNLADGDVPGLIAAINSANANPGSHTINLAPGGTYTLTAVAEDDGYAGGAGLPYIRHPLTINGNGATIQRSSAAGTPDFRIVYVFLSDLTLNGVTIRGGRGGNVNRGGGGIGMIGSNLNVADSTITDNVGFGAGGGGIGSFISTFRIENTTISHNTSFSGYGGGGIINFAAGATSTITSSTIFENQNDSGRGDAIADAFSGPGTMVVKNSVLASPTRGVSDDCYAAPGVVFSQGHNIAGDGTCSLTGPGDMNSTNPLLGPLANNGGNTPTHALLNGSPAIDAIPLADCTNTAGIPITTDQRGVFRPQGARCDIGAYEGFPDPTPTPTPTPSACSLTGAVSHWSAEGNANDVLSSNHGILRNGATFAPGIEGQAFSLNGGYVEVPDSPSLSITGPMTLEAWIKINDNSFQQAIIEKYDVPQYNGYLFRILNGRLLSTMCNTSGCAQPPVAGNTIVTTGTWHHVAAVYDGTTTKLYLDGSLDGSGITGFAATDGPMSLKIGARGDDANTRLGGLIDEARIFNRALTATEIQMIASRSCGADSTPPVIAPSVTGTLGNADWYTSDVEVSWSVTDPESGVSTSTGCETTSVTADTTGVTFTCTATSGGGSANQSVTIKRDASAPSVSCGSADGAWHSSDVSIACTGSDNFSQLANSSDANFSLATSVSAGTETANASTGSRSVCDNAGNCTTAGPVTGNKIDKKSPVITITAPTAGNYLLNQSVPVNFNCTDGGSGVATCTGTSANGGALDTASAGARTFTVTATDNAGNSASPSVINYTVDFGFQVLFDQTKANKSGSTIPIKIRLVDANGANVSSAASLIHAVSVIQIASQASPFIDDAGSANPDFDFRYDASLGGYIFNLKTTGYGTGSYLLSFIAGGNSTVYSVGFQVRQ